MLNRPAAIVSIGRELLTGRTVDTNATVLAAHLADLGVAVGERFTVDDRPTDIARAVRRAWADGHDLVITTGGLGPTPDDCTLQGIAIAWDRLLDLDAVAKDHVLGFYARHHMVTATDKVTLKMARLPVGAEPMANPAGAAPAVWLREAPRATLSLPGVPAELQAIIAGDDFAARISPYRGPRLYRDRRTFPVRDERILALAVARIRKHHRDVEFKPDASGFERGTMDVIVETYDHDGAQAAARMAAALADLERNITG
jgi:molybdenum cofactor synthesis domain-containing protein